jgi:cardiolipin synthase
MNQPALYLIGLGVMHLLGFICSIQALFSVRTPQGAIGWIVSLNALPAVAVPAYLVFGRSKFKGFIFARHSEDSEMTDLIDSLNEKAGPFLGIEDHTASESVGRIRALEHLAKMPLLKGNRVELLVDGEATFASIFEGIDKAADYILIQFFIIHDDDLGSELKRRLCEKATKGIRVYFLYDEVGSNKLPASYIKELQDAGAQIHSFQTTRGTGNRFQLNFRNHRKIVVTDGSTGWVGGHNVGDEYLGKTSRFKGWRDTHMLITGPAVLGLQYAFMEDWNWATDERPSLRWAPAASKHANTPVLILPSGPADEVATASLMFQHAIHSSMEKIWIASPYFVPDDGTINALQLAKMRGVDVRILIPDEPDHLLVYMSAFAFIGKMLASGIEIYRYTQGFMHQKVFLVDDSAAAVGTANLDNRSFRLNFEITAIVLDQDFARQVEQMLRADFLGSRKMTLAEIEEKPFWFKAAARAAYLTAPLQ